MGQVYRSQVSQWELDQYLKLFLKLNGVHFSKVRLYVQRSDFIRPSLPIRKAFFFVKVLTYFAEM